MPIRHCQKCGLKVVVADAQSAPSPLYCQSCQAAAAAAPPPRSVVLPPPKAAPRIEEKTAVAPPPPPPPPPPAVVAPPRGASEIFPRAEPALAPAAEPGAGAAAETWRYYARLERDVREVLSWVEWDLRHFPVYSSQLGMLLVRAGHEAEVLLRELHEKAGGVAAPGAPLPELQRALESAYRLSRVRIALRRVDRSTTPFGHHVYAPFEGFERNAPPPWWDACELSRKARHEHATKGSFENAVKALGAVLWLNLLNLKPATSDRIPMPFPPLEIPHPLFELQLAFDAPGALRLDPARAL